MKFINLLQTYGSVAQQVEATVLEAVQCRFESNQSY